MYTKAEKEKVEKRILYKDSLRKKLFKFSNVGEKRVETLG